MNEPVELSNIPPLKHKSLVYISYWIGKITLLVGWGIFLTWFVFHEFFGQLEEDLMIFGFFWIFIGCALCSLALILLGIFYFKNKPQKFWLTRRALGMILLNIPSVPIIIFLVFSIV